MGHTNTYTTPVLIIPDESRTIERYEISTGRVHCIIETILIPFCKLVHVLVEQPQPSAMSHWVSGVRGIVVSTRICRCIAQTRDIEAIRLPIPTPIPVPGEIISTMVAPLVSIQRPAPQGARVLLIQSWNGTGHKTPRHVYSIWYTGFGLQ